MADPVSIGASAVTLIDSSSTCLTQLVKLIKCLQNAPAEIEAFSNDLTDLQHYFDDVKDLCEKIRAEPTEQFRFPTAVYKPLKDAEQALADLGEILKKSHSQTSSAQKRLAWILRRAKAKKIHKQLQRIKSELGAALVLSIKADGHHVSTRITRIETRLEALQSTAITHIPFLMQIFGHQLENRFPSLPEGPHLESGCRSPPNTPIGDADLDQLSSTALIVPSGDSQIEGNVSYWEPWNVDGAKSLLRDRKASLTDVDPNHGRTPLHYAVIRNKTDMCELLLGVGADPHLQDDDYTTPSQKAWEQILCKRGTVAEIDGLKRLFPGTEELETWEFSYVHKVVLEIFPGRLADELQNEQYRSQIHAVDSTNRTPLHWAAIRKDVEAVRYLLEAGSDANCRDSFNNTPLTFAASTGSVPILELLILHGANVHARTSKGSQALHNASRHQRAIEPVKTLLRAGASLNSTNDLGHSPLSGAAIQNRHEIGGFLLDKGADMNVRSLHGDTPLFQTIFHNSHEFLQLLLERGASPNDVNNAGSTLLRAAASEADARTVEILRTSNIDWTQCLLRDPNGSIALEKARRRVSPPKGFLEEFEQLVAALGREGRLRVDCPSQKEKAV
ncbi:uncharacterized protein Z519_03250 [Cladophialophora bantiana CBS 173.52]|uniref:Fungal N-terminal domain-containing protein n=1 Tax=Cladophialophora bantiana (strain ATCC 10958 / CBS 173.52 / CDC B-1940 / NIH 8579) TaxID=1442370 RepID=A0A0D2HRR5_CLAB1|nr:uncharacterized protein Z519_03250 [Cladophialophora bantiana CBS 173.52]KIW96183.1 hypothetical protein Z519_03250 [Cladophialophora bantiana CBS 173.52]